MELLSDVRELTISGWGNIYESCRSRTSADFKLANLIKLEIHEPYNNLNLLEVVMPDSLKTLKMGQLHNRNQSCWDAAILGKQTRLEELSLEDFKIDVLNYDPENCHIRKMKIRELSFQNQISFKQFSDFMVIQESVVELELQVGEKELKAHDYAGILTHLLSLKSLKKLDINCSNCKWNVIFAALSKINLCNPAVDTLVIKTARIDDLKSFPKFFPNITDLKINNDYFSVDLNPINSMTKIRKLEIDYIEEEMLTALDLKQMRELVISKSGSFILPTIWKTFFINHCQLEFFHLTDFTVPIQLVSVSLENLPLLKSLELTVDCFIGIDDPAELCRQELLSRHRKEQSEKAAKLIGENYDHFEHLKLDLREEPSIERIVLYSLEKYYPGVKLQK
jgi:hypothetical protein